MIDVAVWRAEILAKRSQEALTAYEAAMETNDYAAINAAQQALTEAICKEQT